MTYCRCWTARLDGSLKRMARIMSMVTTIAIGAVAFLTVAGLLIPDWTRNCCSQARPCRRGAPVAASAAAHHRDHHRGPGRPSFLWAVRGARAVCGVCARPCVHGPQRALPADLCRNLLAQGTTRPLTRWRSPAR